MTEIADQVLDKYQIIEEIGHGGFATVYRAKDTELEREVALKVLDPLLMRDGAFVERFQREARSAARLEHPQIVPIYDVGEGAGRLFIAMRLIRGPSLAQYLVEKQRLSWEESLQILNKVGDALAYAHDEGVIHRDLKPDNILLDERSGALLTDFGFARLVGTSSLTQSISGGIVGTPAYIPPEIWEGVKSTSATDVYALACVTYEMLTGEVLFGGETPMAIMRAHDQGAVMSDAWPDTVPDEIRSILETALAKSSQKRTKDVASFLQALNALNVETRSPREFVETGELLRQSRQALSRLDYEAAVIAAERLLELVPEHSQGKQLLKRAKHRLQKRDELLEREQDGRAQLKQEHQKLATKRAEIESLLETVQREKGTLIEERVAIRRRMKELDRSIRDLEKKQVQAERELEELPPAIEKLRNREDSLDKVMSCIQKGRFDEANWLLKTAHGSQDNSARSVSKWSSRNEEIKLDYYKMCPRCGSSNPVRFMRCLSCGSSLKSS